MKFSIPICKIRFHENKYTAWYISQVSSIQSLVLYPLQIHQHRIDIESMKIIIGAGETQYPGWINTQQDQLDLLKSCSFEKICRKGTVDCFLAEHVWEHLTIQQGKIAAKNCFEYLKPGGYLRVAVPDKNFKNEWYQNLVKVGGPGPKDHPAATHKVVYGHKELTSLLKSVGFKTQRLEFCDKTGSFHYRYWNSSDGHIGRSYRYDTRNTNNNIQMVSLIVDAYKPLILKYQ